MSALTSAPANCGWERLNNVSFTVGEVPWKIFRVNSIYFAVFGRGDEQFPRVELAQLAAGLNRKSK